MNDDTPTVLVVEDEAMLAFTMEMSLQDAGYGVVLASNGDLAILELEEDPDRFAAVVTDVRMPGKASGWDVGRRARELRQKLPVLYATGDSESAWKANGVVGSALLIKPFPLEALVRLLDGHLRKLRQQ